MGDSKGDHLHYSTLSHYGGKMGSIMSAHFKMVIDKLEHLLSREAGDLEVTITSVLF